MNQSDTSNNISTVIDIRGLTKDYTVGFLKKRTVRALDSLTLEVRQGEIFGFLGPNGAGKTTTLKLLMRLIFPSAGSARILGQPIEDISTHARIGYLPENPYFYDYLSGVELLRYTGSLFGMTSEEGESKANELLRLVGLDGDRGNRQLRKYSKGMLQRIGIAQSLVNDPEVVFMDEPMSGLDPIGRREVRDLLLALRQQGKTIFFSSHILSDVEALCDRAAILTGGRLVRYGTVEEMTANEGSEVEVIAIGVNANSLEQYCRELSTSLSFSVTPNGVRVLLPDESGVDDILALIRRAGGKLVSVNPQRSSLEDLFSRAGERS
jgi:ABC-2 type transport system ATP-binding protein